MFNFIKKLFKPKTDLLEKLKATIKDNPQAWAEAKWEVLGECLCTESGEYYEFLNNPECLIHGKNKIRPWEKRSPK